MRSIGSRGALSGPGLQLSELAAPAPATAAPAPDTEALAPGEAESALAPDAAGKPHTGIDPDDRDIAIGDHVVLTVTKNKEIYNGKKAKVLGILSKHYKLVMLDGKAAGKPAKMPHANCVLDEASRTPAPDQDPETIYILSGS